MSRKREFVIQLPKGCALEPAMFRAAQIYHPGERVTLVHESGIRGVVEPKPYEFWARLSDGGTVIDRNIRGDAQRVAAYGGFTVLYGPNNKGLWRLRGDINITGIWYGGPEDAAMVVEEWAIPEVERQDAVYAYLLGNPEDA